MARSLATEEVFETFEKLFHAKVAITKALAALQFRFQSPLEFSGSQEEGTDSLSESSRHEVPLVFTTNCRMQKLLAEQSGVLAPLLSHGLQEKAAIPAQAAEVMQVMESAIAGKGASTDSTSDAVALTFRKLRRDKLKPSCSNPCS